MSRQALDTYCDAMAMRPTAETPHLPGHPRGISAVARVDTGFTLSLIVSRGLGKVTLTDWGIDSGRHGSRSVHQWTVADPGGMGRIEVLAAEAVRSAYWRVKKIADTQGCAGQLSLF